MTVGEVMQKINEVHKNVDGLSTMTDRLDLRNVDSILTSDVIDTLDEYIELLKSKQVK